MANIKIYLDGLDLYDMAIINTNFQQVEEKNYVGQDLINLYDFNLELYNEDDTFNPYSDRSIFWGRDVTDPIITIYEDDRLVFEGNSDSLEFDESTNIATVHVSSILNSISRDSVTYFDDNITPAHAYFNLLTLYGYDSFIDPSSYYRGDLIQTENGLLCSYTYDISQKTTVLQILQDISDKFGVDLYTKGQQIIYDQFNPDAIIQPYLTFSEDDVTQCKFSISQDNIQNDFQATTSLFSNQIGSEMTAVGADSREKYGQCFAPEINTSSDQGVHCENLSALIATGELVITKNQNIKQYVEFDLDGTQYNKAFGLGDYFTLDWVADINWEIIRLSKQNDIYSIRGYKV